MACESCKIFLKEALDELNIDAIKIAWRNRSQRRTHGHRKKEIK